MFINILLKIHFEVDKQLSIMYYMLSLKETFLRRSINEEGTEASAGTYGFYGNR